MRFLQKHKDLQSGQAMVLIALAFVGLAAFIGLATDAGILFSSVGSLRRAVDAAALSASNQFREGQSQLDIEASARQFIKINLASYDPILDDPPDNPCDPEDPESDCDIAVRVQTCENDVTLCPPGSQPKKLVRVEADMRVDLAFLPIIGYDFTVIRANAISEAGSVDLVLVIDTSPSMAYDLCTDVDGDGNDFDNDGDGVANSEDCPAFGTMTGGDGIPESDVARCNDSAAPLACKPFVTVKDDAKELVRSMYFPYDRVAIIGFARTSCDPIKKEEHGIPCGNVLDLQDETWRCHDQLLSPTEQRNCVLKRIDDMVVEEEPIPADCPGWAPDPSGCTSTNTGDALRAAGNLFKPQGREEAVWVVVLLSDGVANAALRGDGTWICPNTDTNSTWDGPPYCQDGELPPKTLDPPRSETDPDFDADDHARRMALFVGCPNEVPTETSPCSEPGNDVFVFTICLGDACFKYDRGGDPEVGGELLQFIAAVGDSKPTEDPCESFDPTRKNCGNYYFAAEVSELGGIFEDIASRIYTKLNH
jgi:hypothetical protein